jgi:hypothetical protein
MKKSYTLLAALVITVSTFAQAPEKMSYQAVLRDSGDALVTNQAVGMQISILQVSDLSNPNPTIAYSETHTPTTNANGLVSIAIGTGSVVSGTFATIDWSIGAYSIQTDIDPTLTLTNYTITGTSELLSVPFAFHATNGQDSGTNAGDMQYWNGSSWEVVDATPNEGAALQMIGGVPTWVGGTPPPPPASIGDLRAGGVVFWVDPTDNTHGLVCALSDYESKVQWGCLGTDLPSVPNVPYTGGIPVGLGAEIGDGSTNTDRILRGTDCPTAPAALAARSYGSEWFLPSINELNEMDIHKDILEGVAGVTPFRTDNYYWSSTEDDYYVAWVQNLVNGGQYSTSKDDPYGSVRAVRAF